MPGKIAPLPIFLGEGRDSMAERSYFLSCSHIYYAFPYHGWDSDLLQSTGGGREVGRAGVDKLTLPNVFGFNAIS